MKTLRSLILIVCIMMLPAISVIGNPKTDPSLCHSRTFLNGNPLDTIQKSQTYEISKDELIKTRMIIEENKSMHKSIQDFKRIDSMQTKSIQSLQETLINCEDNNELKDNQISKLEHTPRVETIVDTEPWYENPLYVTLGFVLGLVTGHYLIK